MQEHRVEIRDDIVDLEVQGQVEINPFARAVKRVVAELPVLELGVVAAGGVHVAGHVEGEIISAGLWDHFLQAGVDLFSQVDAVDLGLSFMRFRIAASQAPTRACPTPRMHSLGL